MSALTQNLGPHAGFILASYGAVAIVLVGLTLSIVLDHRAQAVVEGALDVRDIAL